MKVLDEASSRRVAKSLFSRWLKALGDAKLGQRAPDGFLQCLEHSFIKAQRPMCIPAAKPLSPTITSKRLVLVRIAQCERLVPWLALYSNFGIGC